MADNGTGEKTEEATPKRKREAREEGNVAKGKEISQAFTLLASFMFLYFLMQQIFFGVLNQLQYYFKNLIVRPFTINMAFNIFMMLFFQW